MNDRNWGSLKVKTKAGYGALTSWNSEFFFFHLQTAYAILRPKGGSVGEEGIILRSFIRRF